MGSTNQEVIISPNRERHPATNRPSGAPKSGWAEGMKASAASAGTSAGAGGLLGGTLTPAIVMDPSKWCPLPTESRVATIQPVVIRILPSLHSPKSRSSKKQNVAVSSSGRRKNHRDPSRQQKEKKKIQ